MSPVLEGLGSLEVVSMFVTTFGKDFIFDLLQSEGMSLWPNFYFLHQVFLNFYFPVFCFWLVCRVHLLGGCVNKSRWQDGMKVYKRLLEVFFWVLDKFISACLVHSGEFQWKTVQKHCKHLSGPSAHLFLPLHSAGIYRVIEKMNFCKNLRSFLCLDGWTE